MQCNEMKMCRDYVTFSLQPTFSEWFNTEFYTVIPVNISHWNTAGTGTVSTTNVKTGAPTRQHMSHPPSRHYASPPPPRPVTACAFSHGFRASDVNSRRSLAISCDLQRSPAIPGNTRVTPRRVWLCHHRTASRVTPHCRLQTSQASSVSVTRRRCWGRRRDGDSDGGGDGAFGPTPAHVRPRYRGNRPPATRHPSPQPTPPDRHTRRRPPQPIGSHSVVLRRGCGDVWRGGGDV